MSFPSFLRTKQLFGAGYTLVWYVLKQLWLSLLLGDLRYIGKKPVKHCLNARAKMTSDKFDDERLLARKTHENEMKNG